MENLVSLPLWQVILLSVFAIPGIIGALVSAGWALFLIGAVLLGLVGNLVSK